MASLKLYGIPYSTATQTALTVLKEKGLDYQFIPVELMKGEQKAPDYVAKQPFSQIPLLEDGDYRLFESRAISKYLATQYADRGTPLVPPTSDACAQGLLDQAISMELASFHPNAFGICKEKFFKPKYYKKPTDETQLQEYVETLSKKMDVYDKMLGAHAYLAGDSLTIADLHHLPYGNLITALGFDHLTNPSRSNVVRWWKEISSRPSWGDVVQGASLQA